MSAVFSCPRRKLAVLCWPLPHLLLTVSCLVPGKDVHQPAMRMTPQRAICSAILVKSRPAEHEFWKMVFRQPFAWNRKSVSGFSLPAAASEPLWQQWWCTALKWPAALHSNRSIQCRPEWRLALTPQLVRWRNFTNVPPPPPPKLSLRQAIRAIELAGSV